MTRNYSEFLGILSISKTEKKNVLGISENGKLLELHSWESLGIFDIQSSLPLTDSDTNQHNNLEMVDKLNIHKALTEALKIIYLKSERSSYPRK